MNEELRKRIRAFVQATSEEQDLMCACAFLEWGKDTSRQGERVLPHLETLATRKLAVRRGAGWRLTRAGRQAAATYLALGIAMCESAGRESSP
jgi:hypothetical protein